MHNGNASYRGRAANDTAIDCASGAPFPVAGEDSQAAPFTQELSRIVGRFQRTALIGLRKIETESQ
jgi:hypothetical protein